MGIKGKSGTRKSKRIEGVDYEYALADFKTYKITFEKPLKHCYIRAKNFEELLEFQKNICFFEYWIKRTGNYSGGTYPRFHKISRRSVRIPFK